MKAASYKIPPPQYSEVMKFNNEQGKIPEIIGEIEAALKEGVYHQLHDFSRDFPMNVQGLGNLWRWVKGHIKYKEDSGLKQIIQEPVRLNQSRRGDCKSMSLFVASVAACWNCPFTLMYVHYPDTGTNHVYCVVHTEGGDVICDTVWTRFNSQKEPFRLIRKQFYHFSNKNTMSEIYRFGSVGAMATVDAAVNHFENSTKDLPEVNPATDVTRMSENGLVQHISGAFGVYGFGSVSTRAFTAPMLILPEGMNGIGANGKLKAKVQKVIKKAGEVAKKVVKNSPPVLIAKAVQKAWQKVANWIFNGMIQKASDFFLYTFITKAPSAKIEAKRKKQLFIVDFIAKVTGSKRETVMASISAAITKKHGKTPQQILNAAAKSQIASVGVIALSAAAVGTVIEIIKKIVEVFKKKKDETPVVSSNDGSNVAEIEVEAKGDEIAPQTPPVQKTPSGVPIPTVPVTPEANAETERKQDTTPQPMETPQSEPKRTPQPQSKAPLPPSVEPTETDTPILQTPQPSGGVVVQKSETGMAYAVIAAALVGLYIVSQ